MRSAFPSRIVAPYLVVVAGILAYHNSFSVPFLLDDQSLIVENPYLRHFWTAWQGMWQSKRPVLEMTLALNYALGGLNVWGYHAFNLSVHLGAALLLLGIVRRTLENAQLEFRFRRAAAGLALVIALMWVVHPLTTQSVTYLIQRAESLAGFFYLSVLYSVIRGVESRRRWLWHAAAVLACALGTGCKATLVSAPVVVLLYDRTFLTGSFRGAWAARRGLYLGLAASWGILAAMIAFLHEPKPTVGFGLEGISAWGYAATQPAVLLHYLKLALRPVGLVFDYSWPVAKSVEQVVGPALGVGALLLAVGWALRQGMRVGFLGGWFFLTLAPTSSFIPLQDLAFEYRMYLPLAAVVTLVVLTGWTLLGRPVAAHDPRRHLAIGLAIAVVLCLGWATAVRNHDYRSALALWSDTVAKRPENPRAHNELGNALSRRGQPAKAILHYRQAVALRPDEEVFLHNLSRALILQGEPEEALLHSRRALSLNPQSVKAHLNLGNALLEQGQTEEAMAHFTEALALDPASPKAHGNLGFVFARQGQWERAVEHYRKALQLNPTLSDQADLHFNLGNALAQQGRLEEAIAHYTETLRIDPADGEAQERLRRIKAAAGIGSAP